MIVEQIWTGNSGRNFFYMVACAQTGEAAAIDPIDPPKCLAAAKEHGWDITRVINTHEHMDHIGGNDEVIAATDAKLIGPYNSGERIPNIDEGVREGDVIKFGRDVELQVLETPGHTPIHISLLAEREYPHLLCGDTLFNAGVGHCRSGDPHELYATFRDKITPMADDTRVYPGHEYLANNLEFTLDREPDNVAAQAMLAEAEGQDPDNALITTLGIERQINTFLRLDSPSVIEALKEKFDDLPAAPDKETVFLKLRELRNNW